MKLQSRDQWKKTQPKDLGKSHCPFCDIESQPEYIIWKGKYWLIIHNKFPILGNPKHIMLIPKKHRIFPYECSPEEMSEFPKAQKVIHDFFNGEKYFSFMRESKQSRSLEHFHYHYIPGEVRYKVIEQFLIEQGFTNQLDSE